VKSVNFQQQWVAMSASFVKVSKGPARAVLLEEDKPEPPAPPPLKPSPVKKDAPPPSPQAYVPPVDVPVLSNAPAAGAIAAVVNTWERTRSCLPALLFG
jgi:hypothetical protein